MAAGQTIPTTPRYAATIITSDPTSGTIQANIKGDSRSIIVINTPIAFRWPIDGETWVVRQENGTWYLDSPIPDPNASTSFKSINPGDAIINSPTGVVHVIGGDNQHIISYANNTAFISDKDYAVQNTDGLVIYTTLTYYRSVVLPPTAVDGQRLVIQDGTGVADEYPIIILGPVNGGFATAVFESYGTVTLIWQETQWLTDGWACTAPPPPTISGTTYYISPTGNDSNSGTSPSEPLQTVAYVNTLNLSPGQGILFEGGQVFDDARFEPNLVAGYTGTLTEPIVISSYGTGRAILSQGVLFHTGTAMTFDSLIMGNTFQGGSALDGGLVSNNITLTRSMISVANAYSSTALGIFANGSDWTVAGCIITTIGNSGMLTGEAGNTISGFVFDHNLVCDIGLNTELGYNSHGCYTCGSDFNATENLMINCGESAFSQRVHNHNIIGNHIAGGQVGIDFYESDTIVGTSVWHDNTIAGCSDGGIYVASGGSNNQTVENFVISENRMRLPLTAIPFLLEPTTGYYQKWGNIIYGGNPEIADELDPFDNIWGLTAYPAGLTYSGTFANQGTTPGTWLLDGNGYIHLEGSITATSGWYNGGPIATLPPGSRPGSDCQFLIPAIDSVAGNFIANIVIYTTGEMDFYQFYPASFSPATLSQAWLSGITFRQVN